MFIWYILYYFCIFKSLNFDVWLFKIFTIEMFTTGWKLLLDIKSSGRCTFFNIEEIGIWKGYFKECLCSKKKKFIIWFLMCNYFLHVISRLSSKPKCLFCRTIYWPLSIGWRVIALIEINNQLWRNLMLGEHFFNFSQKFWFQCF